MLVPNSSSVISVTATRSGRILGVAADNQMYVRNSINEPWVLVPNSGSIIDVTEMPNGTLVAVGSDNNLYTRATINSTWVPVPNSGSVISARATPDGKLYGVGANKQLYLRESLTSQWTFVAESGSIVQAVEYRGNLVSVGSDMNLYLGNLKRPDLTLTITSVKCVAPSTGTDGATTALFASIGALVAVGVTVGTGGTAAPAMISMATAKAAAAGAGTAAGFTEQLGKMFGGTDDLFIKVNNVKVWPDSKSISISSQEDKHVGYSINFLRGRGPLVELFEYDYASDDDFMGSSSFGTSDSENPEDDYVFYNKDEGSFYTVKIKIKKYVIPNN